MFSNLLAATVAKKFNPWLMLSLSLATGLSEKFWDEKNMIMLIHFNCWNADKEQPTHAALRVTGSQKFPSGFATLTGFPNYNLLNFPCISIGGYIFPKSFFKSSISPFFFTFSNGWNRETLTKVRLSERQQRGSANQRRLSSTRTR